MRSERGGEPSGGRDSISIIENHEKECTFHPNPWLRDYIPKVVQLEIPSMRDQVYTFLLNSSLTCLRELGRACRTKHSGVKNTVVCHSLLKGQQVVASGAKDWDDFFMGKYNEFWTNPANVTNFMRACLSDSDIRAFSSEKGEKHRREAFMTSHEFARMIGILFENEEARTSLLRSGLDLTRVEQQRRMDRDAFWEFVVARFHNDEDTVIGMSYVGLVDADEHHSCVNPNKIPQQKRSGVWLKEKFFSVRAAFTRAFYNWTRSGQNNPEGSDFIKFVPRAPSSTTISNVGRYCVILFYAMKCGIKEEDTEVLNFTSKMVPHGAGYDDGDVDVAGTPSGKDSRKRKRVIDELAKESKQRSRSISELVSTVKDLIQTSSTKDVPNESSSNERNLILDVFVLTKQLADLRKISDGSEITKQSIILREAALQRAQERCAALHEGSN